MHDKNTSQLTPDRYLFLCALQNAVPMFWQSFHNSALGGDHLTADEWAVCVDVRDDWLIQVLRDTLARWRERPEDGGSQLLPGYEWFAYAKNQPVAPFAPQLEDPCPRFTGIPLDSDLNTSQPKLERVAIWKTQRIETPTEFADRMTAQFNKALTEYKKYLRQSTQANDIRDQRRDHAQWTALVAFRDDVTVADISERWPSLHAHQDPYATVHKAVQRFASDIGLTLPKIRVDKKSR